MTPPNHLGDVLLIEDNPGDVRWLQEMFAEAGLNPTLHTVADGSDALDFLHKSGDYSDAPRPDVIFLDLHLPRMDGEEVLNEMSDEARDIPVIVLSGSQHGANLKLDDVEAEVEACSEKPLKPDDLLELAELVEE